MDRARIIRMRWAMVGQLHHAFSPDLPALSLFETSLEQLSQAIPQAIAAIYAHRNPPVLLVPADTSFGNGLPAWVAVPIPLATELLARVSPRQLAPPSPPSSE